MIVAKALIALTLLAVPVTAAASVVVTVTEGPALLTCFPAESWDGRSEDRPCDVIGQPEEDGSGFLRLGTVGAAAAACTIPNPYEERGRFAIRCHRVPDRRVAK
jgi:hypothetical protein